MPQLTVLSGVGCPSRRFNSRIWKRPRSKSKRKSSHLGYFSCPTSRKNVDWASRHHLNKDIIDRHKRINKILKRRKVKKLKFKPTVKKGTKLKRRKKAKKVIHSINSVGNFLGSLKIMKKRKRSKGRTLARRAGVRKGKCKKVGRRKVCKTKRGKGYIRKDKIGRKHRSTGKFSLNNIGGFGLANVGAFRADTCAHRVVRAGHSGWKKPRRKGRKKSKGLFGIGLGNIGISMPKVSSITSLLPSLNIASLKKYGAVVSGMLMPLTLQRFLPAKLSTGWKGMLTYLGLGGVTIMINRKVTILKPYADEVAIGVGAGFVLKIFQDVLLKRSLFPAKSLKGVTYLDGVDACVSCDNAGNCGDPSVGRCLGYSDNEVGNISDYDEVSDYDEISDYDEVSDYDEISDYDEVGAYATMEEYDD